MKTAAFLKLTKKQLSGKPVRSVGLITLVGIMSTVFFIGIFIIISLSNGLRCLKERMGADLMLVPLGEEVNTEGILLKGEPGFFYLDPKLTDRFYNCPVEGIEKTENQFFLASASQGCCDMAVQFIGIDEATDFTVTPWIRESMSEEGDYLSDLGIVVGSAIDVPQDHILKFYGRHYRVTGQLEETGTGMDQTVFADMDTIKDLKAGAEEQGFRFLNGIDPETAVSAILIKVKDGYTPEQVKRNIRMAMDGFQIIEAKKLTGSVEDNLRGFVVMLYLLLAAIFVLSYVILAITFKLSVYERASQYALLRGIGATGSQIVFLILQKAAVVSGIGTCAGLAFAAVLVFPFRTAISSAVSIPFLFPDALQTAGIFGIAAIPGLLSGPLSAVLSAIRISKAPIYQSQRSL